MEYQQQSQAKRRLKIDLAELDMAFDNASWTMSYYLDLDTGEVAVVTEDIRFELRATYEELEETEDQSDAAFAEALRRRGLPEWLHEAVEEAHRIEVEYMTRYLDVPQANSRQGYQDMEDFIDDVGNTRLREHLENAIRGRGAFRRFKDVLAQYPHEKERWFAFKDGRVRQRVLSWLEESGVELISE